MKSLCRWDDALRSLGWSAMLVMAICLVSNAPACRAAEGEKLVAHLYFADRRHPFLVDEIRVTVDPGDPTVLSRWLIAELINGSTEGNLPTIPEGTRLRSLFLLEDGTAVVDFTAQFHRNHPGGCRLEQLTLFSVVNSLVLNVPEIKRVKILIDGAEAETLAGHLALEFPLTADMLLTR